ncbi:MAG: type II toxin-antitoxin system Phd/YefM family antitoxin [Spirochaetaceae bacterium]|nr:type II toxin-antitoxin system Phd/YefM family antitoxin [Spirochaetaceae bacterium]
MTTVSKSQFKPRAFEYFRRVQERRETLVITDRGTPVLKIMPFAEDDDADLAALRGSVLRYDDPLEPVHERWESAD